MQQPKPISRRYDDIIRNIEKGIYQIPKFQRDFVWDKNKSAKLIESLLKGYPIGSFILWKTKERLKSLKKLGGKILKEIEKITDSLGATKFRARQIHNWIYLKSVKDIDEMTDLSKKFREELKTVAKVTDIKIKVKQVSSDGTIKYLLEYPDGDCVETVLMRFDNRANLHTIPERENPHK